MTWFGEGVSQGAVRERSPQKYINCTYWGNSGILVHKGIAYYLNPLLCTCDGYFGPISMGLE